MASIIIFRIHNSCTPPKFSTPYPNSLSSKGGEGEESPLNTPKTSNSILKYKLSYKDEC